MGHFKGTVITFAKRCGRAIRKISCFGASKSISESSPAKVVEKKSAASVITEHEDPVVHEETQVPPSTGIVYHDYSIHEPETQIIVVDPSDLSTIVPISCQPSTALLSTLPPKSAGTGRTPSLSSSSCDSDNYSEALTNDHNIQNILCTSCRSRISPCASSSYFPMAAQCSVYQNPNRDWDRGSVISGASHIGVHSPSTDRSRSERSSSPECQQRLRVLYDIYNPPPKVLQEKDPNKYQFFNCEDGIASELGTTILDTATGIIPSSQEIENISC